MKKKALTQQDIAALAAGAPLSASVQAGQEAAADEAALAAAAAAAAATNDESGKGDEGEGGEGGEAAGNDQAQAQAQSGNVEVVAFLQGQIKEKDAAILAASLEMAGLKTKIADMEASHTGLLEIAGLAVNNMRVALNMGSLDVKALSATQVLAEHKSAATQFNEKFKAGGVAAVDAAEASNEVKSANPQHLALVKAVR